MVLSQSSVKLYSTVILPPHSVVLSITTGSTIPFIPQSPANPLDTAIDSYISGISEQLSSRLPGGFVKLASAAGSTVIICVAVIVLSQSSV